MNLELTYEGKKFQWKSNTWGKLTIEQLFNTKSNGLEVLVENWSDGEEKSEHRWIPTYHTVPQLVKLGYLGESEENIRETTLENVICAKQIINRIDSLEQEPILPQGKDAQWKPTAGEMIDVSDDGEKWGEREFQRMNDSGEYICHVPPNGFSHSWKYARPIQDSHKINLPEIPDLEWIKTGDKQGELRVLEHIKLLTLGYQAIVAYLKNK